MGDTEGEAAGKTSMVRQFFEQHPGRVFSPSEVAAQLSYTQQLTIAIINRLANDGYLKKVGRGQFKRVPSVGPADLRAAHESILKVVDSLIGRDVAASMIGEGAFKYQEARGPETITSLINGVQKVFGKEYADRLVSHALSGTFGERSSELLKYVYQRAGVRE